MKRIMIVLGLLLVLSICVFSKNEVKVTYIEGFLRIQTRIAQYTFNIRQGFLNEVALNMEAYNKIYAYGEDGFDLSTDSGKLTPVSATINGKEMDSLVGKTEVFAEKDIELLFNYGDFTKKITIIFGPYYQMDVAVEGKIPENLTIALPRLADFNPNNNTDRVNENGKTYTSYYEKTTAIAIWAIPDSNTSFKLDGSKSVNLLQVSSEGVVIHGYMGPAKKMTFIQAAFPDDYLWLSRTVNSYPKASAWYDPLFYLLVYLMDWLYSLTKNYGWVLILYTLIVRLALYPLSHSQTKSMISRKLLEKNPEYQRIMKIQDNQKKQAELMKFYKQNKVSPAAGCLPTLVQLPIFLLLFAVISYESELFAFGPTFLFWEDLSIGGFAENILIVIVSFFVNFFNTLITSSDAKQAKQGMLLAGIFPFLFITLATGLQIYWVFQSIFQWAITWYLYRKNQIAGISVKEFFGSFKK